MSANRESPVADGAADFLPFASDSAIRRVHSEGLLLLGGGRAVLMQLAHPAVAQGVAEHSSYATQRWKRLLRTLRPMYAIAFGSDDQAHAAAAGVNRMHEAVRGPGYHALDPSLLLWVLATLIDTSLELHSRFLGPLPPADAESYYADMRRVGELLQVQPDRTPPDLAAFRAYFDSAVQSLRVSDQARAIANDLLRCTPLNAPFIGPLRLLTAGTLPPLLREQYGLPWGSRREMLLHSLQSASRATLPRLPSLPRRTPWFLLPPRPKRAQALD
jgi:uncharacterized protein (DUF2236 family)